MQEGLSPVFCTRVENHLKKHVKPSLQADEVFSMRRRLFHPSLLMRGEVSFDFQFDVFLADSYEKRFFTSIGSYLTVRGRAPRRGSLAGKSAFSRSSDVPYLGVLKGCYVFFLSGLDFSRHCLNCLVVY